MVENRLRILGLSIEELKGLTKEEQLKILNKHFHERAKELHPDINSDKSGVEMKILNEAKNELEELIKQGFFLDAEYDFAFGESFKKRDLKRAIKSFGLKRPKKEKTPEEVKKEKIRKRWNNIVGEINNSMGVYNKSHDDEDDQR